MIYTWNSLFIAEFLTATSERYSPDEKCNYYHAVLGPFDRNKLSEILLQIEPKLDEETKEKLVNKFNKNSNKNKGSRTGSILDAMNLM
ncbi:hypothetical protein ECANGB1_1541 [Enterospora canceri]|uniref:Uncharacterized protein n=1 Tax=Enterospora canceri TaxID=1081671 RepID=A0A1Y1S5X2_9MICR|nr:hypothetical protein ECANGB1_1541 [Enterospora canceri]